MTLSPLCHVPKTMPEQDGVAARGLREGCGKAELVEALTGEYAVSPEDAAGDVDAFLAQMRQLNMLIED